MNVEVRKIAALVSLNQLHYADRELVLSTTSEKNQFQLDSVVKPDLYQVNTPANMFRNPLSKPINILDSFWKVQRSFGCDQITYSFAYSLHYLATEINVKFVHNGENVTNILVVNNTGMKVIDLLEENPRIIIKKDPSDLSNNIETVSLLCTHRNMQKLKSDKSYRESSNKIGRGLPKNNEQTPTFDGESEDTIPHWWVVVVTNAQKMYHIDLCGPAYNIYEYEENVVDLISQKTHFAPVNIFESEEFVLGDLVKVSKEFAHKLILTNKIKGGINRPFPNNRQFQTSLGISVTPLETFLTKRSSDKPLFDFISLFATKIAEHLIFEADIDTGVITYNLNQTKFNNKVGKIKENKNKAVNLRLAILLQGQINPVQIKASNLKFFPPSKIKQYLSLEELIARSNDYDMKTFTVYEPIIIVDYEENCHLNGQAGTILRLFNGSFKDDETEYVILLNETKHEIIIKGKYLLSTLTDTIKNNLVENPIILESKPIGLKFFSTMLGQEFLLEIRQTGGSFSLFADPKYRNGLKTLALENFFGDNKQPIYREVLRIAEHPKGERFRRLIIKFKTGISPEEYNLEMSDKDIYSFYQSCVKVGIIRPRDPVGY